VSAPTFDLQSHSRHSDGALAPAEVVAAAADAGVELFALSDHDTVAGVQEARRAAAQSGLPLVSAVEISAVDVWELELHILGYQINERDPVLLERLEDWRADRTRRIEAMADALSDLGYELDRGSLAARAADDKPVGRPHVAQAVVSHPSNAARLADEGLTDMTAFLVAYLIEGRPAYRPRERPTVADAVAGIHEAGGIAVWAHPFWDVEEPERVLERITSFRRDGIDGVECFYLTHTEEQTRLLAQTCAELGLLTTGSSDFHGPEHRQFNRFRAFSTYGLAPSLGPLAAPDAG
jgi:predicted metal-dependent phosphoesterase TrpH